MPLATANPTGAGSPHTLDAAARLAADVNAAAEALEQLKQILRSRPADQAQASLAAKAPRRSDGAPMFAQPPGATMSAQATPLVPVTAHVPAGAMIITLNQSPGRVKISSFLAGFALSAVVAVLLYMCIAPG
jgi:hypothetical protein